MSVHNPLHGRSMAILQTVTGRGGMSSRPLERQRARAGISPDQPSSTTLGSWPQARMNLSSSDVAMLMVAELTSG